jgi:hypothetical protein
VRIANVTRDFKQSETETTSKGDREMGVCEMQRRLWQAESGYQQAKREYDATVKAPRRSYPDTATAAPPLPPRTPEPRGIGWVYCKLVNDVLTVPKAKAQTVRPYGGSTVGRQTPSQSAVPRPAGRLTAIPPNRQTTAAAATIRAIEPDPPAVMQARTSEAKLRLDMAQRSRNRYEIEIHKKFSLAAACLIFVLLGAPIAVRFPRGGVGLVIGVSLIVFALYYVGLIGGESLANEGYVPPFWAMWGTNVILTLVGIVLLFRMGKDSNSGRGGDWGDRIDAIRARFGRGPHARRRTAA